MRKIIRYILTYLDDSFFRVIVNFLYPKYYRPRKGYIPNYKIIKDYFFWQKIIRINGKVPWPVHFTSKIINPHQIEKGICCDPGDNIGIYINAAGGLKLGNNVNIGQNTTITTVNHYKYDHRKVGFKKGISIGNNVWIGANCSIVAGVKIGNNVTIGAGCTIRQDIPDNTTVIGASSSLEIIQKNKEYEWDCTTDILNKKTKCLTHN